MISQAVCVPTCPTGFTNVLGVCTGTPGKVFEIFLDNIIQGLIIDLVSGIISVQTGISSQFYPYYDLTDTYAVPGRGYYFNGYSSYMTVLTNTQLVLNSNLGIQF